MPASIQRQRSANHTLRIVCPNGHLGFAPIKKGSFRVGCQSEPDLICADSGSCDVGPVPLGADISSSPRRWQLHDLEVMLLAARRLGAAVVIGSGRGSGRERPPHLVVVLPPARRLGVPMIIGSAGETGSNSRVDLFVGMIRDLAAKHGLKKFRLGYFYSEVATEEIRRRLDAGEGIEGLDGRPALDRATLDATD